MASLILGAGFLAYDSAKKAKAKRKETKQRHNDTRFSELERQNAERIAQLQKNTCFCDRSDWQGGVGCPKHGAREGSVGSVGGVEGPPPPGYESGGGGGERRGGVEERRGGGVEERRGDELDEVSGVGIKRESEEKGRQMGMDRAEIARINEERRKKQRLGRRLFAKKG